MINGRLDPTKEFTCQDCQEYLKRGRGRAETAVKVQKHAVDWTDYLALREMQGTITYPIPRTGDEADNYPSVAVMHASQEAAREINRDPAAPSPMRIIIDG